jgi:hypothetical protein
MVVTHACAHKKDARRQSYCMNNRWCPDQKTFMVSCMRCLIRMLIDTVWMNDTRAQTLPVTLETVGQHGCELHTVYG